MQVYNNINLLSNVFHIFVKQINDDVGANSINYVYIHHIVGGDSSYCAMIIKFSKYLIKF